MIGLKDVLKKYQSNNKVYKKKMQELRTQIHHQLEQSSIQTLKIQNHKVIQIHKKQQLIQTKLKKNQQTVKQMRKSNMKWIKIYDKLNTVLKQAGDLANYAHYIEEEIKQLIPCKNDHY